MMEMWREWLYPLGFLSSIAFGTRFIVQWITSEIRGESTVPRLFWQISLFGNLALLVHSSIQMQYHVSLIQTCNAVISWRNLNLMREPREQSKPRTVFILMGAAVVMTTTIFSLQDSFSTETWFRTPTSNWNLFDSGSVSSTWHMIGCCGLLFFSCRFWVQWWFAEKHKASYLGPVFWWLSLIGAVLNLIYFLRIADSVNILGHAMGITPYLRNLMLLSKKPRLVQKGESS